jgi:hypothetical protein
MNPGKFDYQLLKDDRVRMTGNFKRGNERSPAHLH